MAESGAEPHLAHQVHDEGQQGLYEYDAVSASAIPSRDERVKDIKNHIRKGKLWEAFERDERVVLLIDEIDKADIEFPNDLLQELDRMEFFVYETGKPSRQRSAPSWSSPQTTRKSCRTPSYAAASSTTSTSIEETMQAIVDVHFPR